MNRSADWQLPRRRDALGFWLRTRLLTARRSLRDLISADLQRWPAGTRWADAPVLAQVRSPLWSDGRPEELVRKLKMNVWSFSGRNRASHGH